MRRIKINQKKGQFSSVILAVVTLFIIGILLFFFNHMNEQMYGSLNDYLEGDPNFNNTEAQQVAEELQGIEQSRIWDYAFLAIFIGIIIQMVILSFATRINVAFFWIFVLLGIIVLIVGTVLSNVWQELSTDPEFATTITRFTITNTVLGTYYPTIVTGIIFIMLLFLFGKFPGGNEL